MKNVKRIAAIVFAVTFIFTLAVAASAVRSPIAPLVEPTDPDITSSGGGQPSSRPTTVYTTRERATSPGRTSSDGSNGSSSGSYTGRTATPDRNPSAPDTGSVGNTAVAAVLVTVMLGSATAYVVSSKKEF